MTKGQKVIIKNTNSIWDGKEGIVEEVNDNTCTVFVNFIPSERKRVRQDFSIDNLESEEYTNSEVNTMAENLNEELLEDVEEEFTSRAIKALAKELDINEEDIEVNTWGGGHVFTTPEGDFWVGNYDDAYDAAYEWIEDIYDDMGLESFTESFRDYILSNLINWDPIEDDMRESYYYYIEDIENENDSEFENRMIQEMYDEGILSDDDFEEIDGDIDYSTLKDSVNIEDKKEEFLDYLCDNIDVQEWVKQTFTPEDFSKYVEDNGLIDLDAVIRECIREDGIAHFLASYDGVEHELDDDLYAYRQN